MRVYCPIEAETLTAMLTGDASAIESDPTLSTILRIIRDDNPLGDFGIYKSVVEIAPGWELFTPAGAARPALGEAGSSSTSPTAILTIYVDAGASASAISTALSHVMEEHPWEVPVIEMNETVLLTRAK